MEWHHLHVIQNDQHEGHSFKVISREDHVCFPHFVDKKKKEKKKAAGWISWQVEILLTYR